MIDISGEIRKNAANKGVYAPFGSIGNVGHRRSHEKPDDFKNSPEFYIDLLCHDISNMNQVAMGYLELAIEKVKQGIYDPVLLAKPMEMMRDSSKLLESVRKIQKIKVEGQPLETFDLGGLLDEMVSQYALTPGREVNIRYSHVVGCTVAASDLLADVFSNLIGNAIKHSSGPVTISIDLAEAIENGIRYYRVDIADDGPGIPDEAKTLIFDRFARGPVGVKGKGLGLYIVRSLIDSFQGRVWVEDRVPGDHHKGCKFVVLLPAAKNSQACHTSLTKDGIL